MSSEIRVKNPTKSHTSHNYLAYETGASLCNIHPTSSLLPVFTAIILVRILIHSHQGSYREPHVRYLLPDPGDVKATTQKWDQH